MRNFAAVSINPERFGDGIWRLALLCSLSDLLADFDPQFGSANPLTVSGRDRLALLRSVTMPRKLLWTRRYALSIDARAPVPHLVSLVSSMEAMSVLQARSRSTFRR